MQQKHTLLFESNTESAVFISPLTLSRLKETVRCESMDTSKKFVPTIRRENKAKSYARFSVQPGLRGS